MKPPKWWQEERGEYFAYESHDAPELLPMFTLSLGKKGEERGGGGVDEPPHVVGIEPMTACSFLLSLRDQDAEPSFIRN